jgi:hypothetical protein
VLPLPPEGQRDGPRLYSLRALILNGFSAALEDSGEDLWQQQLQGAGFRRVKSVA